MRVVLLLHSFLSLVGWCGHGAPTNVRVCAQWFVVRAFALPLLILEEVCELQSRLAHVLGSFHGCHAERCQT